MCVCVCVRVFVCVCVCVRVFVRARARVCERESVFQNIVVAIVEINIISTHHHTSPNTAATSNRAPPIKPRSRLIAAAAAFDRSLKRRGEARPPPTASRRPPLTPLSRRIHALLQRPRLPAGVVQCPPVPSSRVFAAVAD